MVSESSISPSRSFAIRRNTTNYSPLLLPNGKSRHQVGYRTQQLSKEEELALSESSTRFNQVSTIAALSEQIQLGGGASVQRHSNRAWIVHDRDYTVTTYRPTGFTFRTVYDGNSVVSGQGAFGIVEFLGFTDPTPSEGILQNIAGKLMRGAKPSAPGMDLLRFAGEQRDAPALFRASNYSPRNPKEMAGAYLNYIFGVKPTGEDLGRMAELVLRTDKPTRLLIEGEKIRQKTKRTVELYSDSGSYVSSTAVSGMYPYASPGTWGSLIKVTSQLVVPWSSTASSTSSLQPIFNFSWTARRTLRQFTTWEMFVPKPDELEQRLYSYKEKAQLLLSSAKLKESAVWELTPWTWITDWFVDIGGLLRYQRAIVDDQIVATQAGYSLFEEYGAHCSYTGRYDSMYPTKLRVKSDTFTPVSSSILWRRHKRRGSSPFSIGPTWNFSSKQWAILGALGLSKGPDLPNIRV